MGEELQECEFKGQYVCFGREDGTFCWGKIEGEVPVNTPEGPRTNFLLSGMITCSIPMGTPGPVVHATLNGAAVSNAAAAGASTNKKKLGLRHHKGERLVRCDSLNLKRDVMDLDEILDGLTDDEMFIFVMRMRLDDVAGIPLGVKNMVLQGINTLPEAAEKKAIEKKAIEMLKERIGTTE